MPRFFTNVIDENNITLTGSDAVHVGRSLRMKPGEPLTVCCGGIDYNCEISEITSDTVYLSLKEKVVCAAEPNIEVTLFQAVPKMDKLEYIIQKSVELGVSRIVPMLTRRCVSRPDERDFAKKLARLNKIAAEAAKQSGRGIIPQVTPIVSYKKALEMMKELDRNVLLYEEEGAVGAARVWLGKRILRCETAPITALSILMFLTNNM